MSRPPGRSNERIDRVRRRCRAWHERHSRRRPRRSARRQLRRRRPVEIEPAEPEGRAPPVSSPSPCQECVRDVGEPSLAVAGDQVGQSGCGSAGARADLDQPERGVGSGQHRANRGGDKSVQVACRGTATIDTFGGVERTARKQHLERADATRQQIQQLAGGSARVSQMSGSSASSRSTCRHTSVRSHH